MWGNVAEWVYAAVALGALLAAIWAGRTSKRLYDIETGRDHDAADREERAQASGIAAWCICCDDLPEELRLGLQIHNSSDSPVYDVEIHSTYARTQHAEPQEEPALKLAVLPPGDYVVTAHPKYNWTFPEERGAMDHTVRPVTNNKGWKVTDLWFTDAYGVTWHRADSRLTKA